MFPELNYDLNEFINEQAKIEDESTTLGLVPKFDFTTESFVVMNGRTVYCTEQEAVEQWIELCIRTKADHFSSYENTDFGNSSVYTLFGKKSLPQNFLEANLIADLTERIESHKLIVSADSFDVFKDGEKVTIEFTVTTLNGVIKKEVTINV